MSPSTALVRACSGPEAQGDLASLQIVPAEQSPDPDGMERAARTTGVIISKQNNGYRVDSYSPKGAPIRFCGHGALAAGWFVLTEIEPDADELEFFSARQTWRARRGGLHGADVTLTFAAPALAEIDVPGFAQSCIGKPPVAAAESGAADDYLILELADAAGVSAAQPDADAISRHTQRALIVTAPSDDGTACVFRYFAPQYGEPESMVTGSAAVQLAAWWAPRLRQQAFAVRQLSAAGALMQLACHDGVVELAAQVGYG
jgi:predicted PhzF superfamily epimerase YddE/YHI9